MLFRLPISRFETLILLLRFIKIRPMYLRETYVSIYRKFILLEETNLVQFSTYLGYIEDLIISKKTILYYISILYFYIKDFRYKYLYLYMFLKKNYQYTVRVP